MYSYGLFPFVPMGFVYACCWPYNRAKWFLLLATVSLSCYYIYKETLTVAKQWLPYSLYKQICGGVVLVQGLFALLVKFYFMA